LLELDSTESTLRADRVPAHGDLGFARPASASGPRRRI